MDKKINRPRATFIFYFWLFCSIALIFFFSFFFFPFDKFQSQNVGTRGGTKREKYEGIF